MSDFQLTATAVSVVQQDNACIIGFADDPAEPSNFVILQRAINATDQDRKLGQDTYHLEVSGQPLGYGCIQSASLGRQTLTIHVDEAAGRAFETLAISFDISKEEWRNLAEKLQFVFHGTRTSFVIEG